MGQLLYACWEICCKNPLHWMCRCSNGGWQSTEQPLNQHFKPASHQNGIWKRRKTHTKPAQQLRSALIPAQLRARRHGRRCSSRLSAESIHPTRRPGAGDAGAACVAGGVPGADGTGGRGPATRSGSAGSCQRWRQRSRGPRGLEGHVPAQPQRGKTDPKEQQGRGRGVWR